MSGNLSMHQPIHYASMQFSRKYFQDAQPFSASRRPILARSAERGSVGRPWQPGVRGRTEPLERGRGHSAHLARPADGADLGAIATGPTVACPTGSRHGASRQLVELFRTRIGIACIVRNFSLFGPWRNIMLVE